MAGYSGTSLSKKLGLKPNQRIGLLNTPNSFPGALGPLPDGVCFSPDRRKPGPFDLILCFTTDRATIQRRFSRLAARLTPDGALWVAWLKKASGVATHLTEKEVRSVGLEAGLVDVKVCAVDDIWSALRFVYRLKDRPARRI